MRRLPCSALTTCLLAYTSPPDSPRGSHFRRISAPQAIESPTLGTLSNVVQQLVVQQVASEADIQKTVTEALSKASAKYETDAAMLAATAAPRPLQEGIRLPVKPTTITEAKRAFRSAFSGSTLRAPTVKFVNVILDTTCIWKYEYSRVWAVGFTALCDSFLGAVQQGSRLSLSDQMASRTAMCYALGMDADAVAADAAALSRVAATMTAEELLASDDFVQIARVSAFKYTCVRLRRWVRAAHEGHGDRADDNVHRSLVRGAQSQVCAHTRTRLSRASLHRFDWALLLREARRGGRGLARGEHRARRRLLSGRPRVLRSLSQQWLLRSSILC